MSIYTELGVRPMINAAGAVTRYGGSIMAPALLETMQAAAQEFCVLDELQEKVGQRIATSAAGRYCKLLAKRQQKIITHNQTCRVRNPTGLVTERTIHQ